MNIRKASVICVTSILNMNRRREIIFLLGVREERR